MANPGYTALISTDAITGVASISVTIPGKQPVMIADDADNYADLVAAIRAQRPVEEVAKLLTPLEKFKTIVQDAGFEIRMKNESMGVFYEGEQVHSRIAEMILEHHKAGTEYGALKNFMVKAMANVNGVGEADVLYKFIQEAKLPLHPDGDFLAFKATRADGFDKHTGTVLYKVGEYLEVKNFDASKFTQCGQGLHVGDRSYVNSYGNAGRDAFFVVKVNPKDAIYYRGSGYDGKMRVCKLFVYAQIAMGQGVDLNHFLPFMVAHSPEGDILELAALDAPATEAPSDIPEASAEEQAPVVRKKTDKLMGQNAKVETKAGRGKTTTEKKKLRKASKEQSFVSVGKGKMVFATRDNRQFTAKQVLANVANLGQRGWAAEAGIPRTTIQEWLKAIEGKARNR